MTILTTCWIGKIYRSGEIVEVKDSYPLRYGRKEVMAAMAADYNTDCIDARPACSGCNEERKKPGYTAEASAEWLSVPQIAALAGFFTFVAVYMTPVAVGLAGSFAASHSVKRFTKSSVLIGLASLITFCSGILVGNAIQRQHRLGPYSNIIEHHHKSLQ